MNWRLKRGLFWKTHKPPMPWKPTLVVISCLLAYLTVAAFDNLKARAAEMEQLAESNAGLAQVVIDCLNGASGFYFKDADLAFSCGAKL